jgi:uncharacterized protein (DUF2267 family)
MAVTQIPDVFQGTCQKTQDWLRELQELGHFRDEAQSYSVLRAVLHALRDRLMPDEAAHLGAELPMLIRGLYYEGWKPAATPHRGRTLEDFFGEVEQQMRFNVDIAPQHAVSAVFALLDRKISAGEVEDVRDMLPAAVRALWN